MSRPGICAQICLLPSLGCWVSKMKGKTRQKWALKPKNYKLKALVLLSVTGFVLLTTPGINDAGGIRKITWTVLTRSACPWWTRRAAVKPMKSSLTSATTGRTTSVKHRCSCCSPISARWYVSARLFAFPSFSPRFSFVLVKRLRNRSAVIKLKSGKISSAC